MKPEEQLQAQIQTAPAPADPIREEDKIMLVLAYLGPLALIPLLTVKDSAFVRWHAKNGLVLGAAALVVLLVAGFIPFLGTCLLFPIALIGFMVLTVMAIIKALRGERWRIPAISDLAEKF
jgi:uncharacterized membrane protein